MIPSPSAEQSAIASQLARELASYRDGLQALLHGSWDPERYRSLSEQFDRMQMLVGAFPRWSLPWTELLISRAELMHALWNLRTPARVDGRVQALHALHGMRVDELLDCCRRCEAAAAPDARVAQGAAPTDRAR